MNSDRSQPRRRGRWLRIAVVCAVCVLGVAVYWTFVRRCPPDAVRAEAFPTTAWRDLPGYYAIYARYERPEGGDFLIRPEMDNGGQGKTFTIYRYLAEARRFEPAPFESWERAGAPQRRCKDLEVSSRSPRIRIDYKDLRLFVDGKEIETAAWATLRVYLSPSEKFLSVVSAAGRRPFALWPGSSSKPRGPYYHQVFRLPSLEQVGPTVLIPDENRYSVCWMPDERFIINGIRNVVVIPVEKGAGE